MDPTPPVMENTSMPLVKGIVGAAAGAFGAMEDSPFSKGGNTGGGTEFIGPYSQDYYAPYSGN